ncbi:MAG: insulinase family protein [Leptospira sp.]|nr:insulinase family protein [Leptospira sp.]
MRTIKFLFFIPIFFISFTISSEQVFREIAQKLESKTKIVTLENGLRLILVDRPESPTLAIYSKFLVGAVDETDEIAGTAHLLEHMLFKGTPNVGTSDFALEEKYQIQIEIWGSRLDKLRLQKRHLLEKGMAVPKDLEEEITTFSRRLKNLQELQDRFIIKNEDSYIYEQSGQVGFNAYTSQDVTNYQIQLPSNRLEIWAKMESDRLKNPVLREYYTERDVVIEERRMRTENSGSGLLRERFLATAFEAHPYRRPIIGYPSVIPFLDVFETKEFFKKYYHPGNLVITIVGKQDFAKTEQIVRKYFGDIPQGPKRGETKISEIQSPGRKQVEVFFPSGEMIYMGWRKPSVPHPDNSVFDVLEGILAKGASSRLYKKLVLESNLCSGIRAYNGSPGERYTNLFSLAIQNNQDADVSQIEKIIWDELQDIAKNGVRDDEIQMVKNDAMADFFRYMDKNSSVADSLGYYELLTGDWKNLFRVYDQLNSVTSGDLSRVINTYLLPEKVTVAYLKDSRKQNSKATGEGK